MSGKIYIEDIDVVRMFIDEWLECLEGLEKEILKLEVHSDDMELLNTIFRRVHSIKGGSSFVGLSCITSLSHEVEFTLDVIRKRKVYVNTDLIDSLLMAVDYLNAYINVLSIKIKEHDIVTENGKIYLFINMDQDVENLIEGIKHTRENCEKLILEESEQKASQESLDVDILQSEEFKKGLAEGIKEQFVLECSEHLENIENEMLNQLDKNGQDKEAIHELFRAVHSIKGGTGIYLSALTSGYPLYGCIKRFSEIIHNFESLLSQIRDKNIEFEKGLIDLSYLVVDYAKVIIQSISTEEQPNIDGQELILKISEYHDTINQLPGSINSSKTAKSAEKEDNKTDEYNKQKSTVSQSIRVNQEKIDKMMNMISELIIAKNSFMHIATKLNVDYSLPEISKEVKQVGAYVNRISDELQNAIMSIRMVEIRTVFQKMPRVVRDIGHNTGKKMELILEGENTEIDKTIVEQISDPLVHLIRNSADHGIEDPKERLRLGKPETGTIILRAYNKNKFVYIEIEDDGKGLDGDKICEKAIEKGFITKEEAEKMTYNQLVNLIFLPGFSTAKKITEVSGRGVGMDIVKSNIMKINGSIKIESKKGQGTKMIIQLPLTLAISHGLVVEVGCDSFIFPLEHIAETVKIPREEIHEYNGKYFTYLRGEVIGADWLCKIFDIPGAVEESEELNAVIISNGSEKLAIIVDKLKSEQEFVVKTLDGALASIEGISGSTLLGNGKVVLIVNPIDLFKLV